MRKKRIKSDKNFKKKRNIINPFPVTMKPINKYNLPYPDYFYSKV